MESSNESRISRRDFLRKAGIAGAGTAISIGKFTWDVQRTVSDSVWAAIRYPAVTDGALAINESIINNAENIQNPDFRPMTEILKEGIEKYEQETKQKAYFEEEPDFRPAEYYANGMKRKLMFRLGVANLSKISQALKELAPGEANLAIFDADIRLDKSFILADCSGLSLRFRHRNADLFYDGKVKNFDEYFARAEKQGKEEVDKVRSTIDAEYQKTGMPVTSAKIFAHYLRINAGNIGLAMTDTYVFCKYASRSENSKEWFGERVKDEFAGSNYNRMPEGEERENLKGKTYHSWAFPHLRRYFPVEVIRLGGITRQIIRFDEQGIKKTAADARTLSDLREIEKILQEYQI